MARERTRAAVDAVPVRDELDALVHRYQHLQNEHQRAAPESTMRRRLEAELLQVRERFDRMLEEWVDDQDLRRAWVAHLHNREAEPPAPEAIPRVVFRGRSDAGSEVEVRGADDELAVTLDGTLVARVAAEKDLAAEHPPVRFRLDEFRFDETFRVSPAAVSALRAFVEAGGTPPWEHASELLADGLVDVHFDLMPRGRRALAVLPA
jgi:hypothetical protein